MLKISKKTIGIAGVIFLFLCSAVFAAEVSVIAEESLDNPGTGGAYIYFDANNKIHLAHRAASETAPVDCNASVVTGGNVILDNPKSKVAVVVRCTDNSGAVISSTLHVPNETQAISAVAYDSKNQLVYLTTRNYDQDYNKLYKFNLKNGEGTELDKLPRPFWSGRIPADAKSLLLTPDGKYLVLLASVSSRLNGHDLFMVYDVENNKWIYKQKFGSGHGGQIIMGKGNNVGLYYYEQSQNKLVMIHYLIS